MSVDNLDSGLRALNNYDGVPLIGTVVNNTDPLNLSRVKVQIDGLYEPDKGEVPWAGPLKSSPFGASDSWGVYGSPAVGSDVVVYLQNGDPHYPMYYSIQRYPNSQFASGTTWGFVDPKGNKFKVDLTSGSMELTTNDNVVFRTDGSGNLSVTVPGTTTVHGTSDITVTSDANINLNASTLNVTAAVNIQGNITSNGTVTNNGKDIGSTHKHGGVKSGSDTSGTPI